jgi:hypothetical protein
MLGLIPPIMKEKDQKRRKTMTDKVIKINTHLPVIPDWLKFNSSINFKLPFKSARELAKKLSEVRDDVDVELNFAAGKEIDVEIKYESKTQS